ncbi:helix-turn-helix domain-containing protein [Halococcus agarilyticus]|uniref:helix-turn-helix domain-containing protein n=1 Tax=Halococcus agarilyticus TaxID=1232219 RepID=UPI000677F831|nr:helix-turn-helix domain-containing protein [Halococcus agarilyticus]
MSVTNIVDAKGRNHEYQQVRLTLWHPDCWTLKATDRFPGTHIVENSLYTAAGVIKGDFILICTGEASTDEFAAGIDEYDVVESVTVLEQSRTRARTVVRYDRHSSIVPEIVNSEFMPIEPVHITGGKEHWTVLVRSDALSGVIESMRAEYDVELDAVETVDPGKNLQFTDMVDRIHDDLSKRQLESLFAAYDREYYNWPRGVSATEIAEDVGISGPTFLEHLRRGEQKVLPVVIDALQDQRVDY